jgi:protein CpxP
MTTRFKTTVAAGIAAMALATAAPMLMASGSADKAAADQQDTQQRRPGPGFGGGRGGPGMRGPGGPMMGIGPAFRQLDLTDDQKAQLKTIAQSHREEFKAAGDKARAAHDGMAALVQADAIDEAAIRAKSADIAAADADMMILTAKVRKEAMQILTADQLTKLKELQARHQGPRGPRGQR